MWSETKKQELLRRFGKLYPDPKSELTFSNDFELVVSVILSAQCTDKKVNEVTLLSFERIRISNVSLRQKLRNSRRSFVRSTIIERKRETLFEWLSRFEKNSGESFHRQEKDFQVCMA